MSDRELLEMAAKACRMTPPWDSNDCFIAWIGSPVTGHWWNPLSDDGDALRLAITLRLDLMFFNGYEEIHVEPSRADDIGVAIEKYCDDMGSSVRRAIVRAAAEIGRAMP